MNRKPNETAAAAAVAVPATQTELTTLLLDVLRGVNRAAQDVRRPLDGKAVAAINRFRQIDIDLFVLPENSIGSGNNFSNSPTRA